MGHRHLFSTPEVFEMDHDQNRNLTHVEQPSLHLGRASALENGSFISPMENMSTGGVNFAPHWNSALRSNEYSSSSVVDLPHYQVAASGPSYDPFLQSSVAGSFCPVPQNYADRPSSSSYHGHIIHGAEGSIDDSAMGNGRGPCKRKSPAIPSVCDGGSTSRYYNAGSSSDLSLSSDLQPEKMPSGSQHCPWVPMGATPSHRGSNLSITEGSQRNVRSRSTIDLEADLARTHLSNNPYRHLHLTGPLVDHSDTVELTGQNVNATTREWNHVLACPAARGRIITSDTNGLSHGMDQLLVGSSSTDSSADFSGYRHDLISSRNSVPPQNIHCPAPQAVRGSHSSYAHRAIPAYRVTASYPRSRYVAASSEDGMQSLPEAYSSRHSRPVSTIGWRSTDRNGRPRIYYERLRALADEADAHDRLVSEGLMMVDRSALYGSRNPLDQHRDMRLDIDNMSYEELLALGERIGHVSTGLSEDLISNCLKETILDQIQEQGSCVICLEEYQSKEEVGTLTNCSHEYHVGCIKKWLLMKNVCPICKAPAMGENLKEK